MTKPRLSVVIPTRNRPESLDRLLHSLSGQTLAPEEFEVVVVDDGSIPHVDQATLATTFAFDVRVVRRERLHGAHASRYEGAVASRGERVLFLDDDVVPMPRVLADHALIVDAFGLGPILYHPDAVPTPYNRFQARQYAQYVDAVVEAHQTSSVIQLYICNASGPTGSFRDLLKRVTDVMGGLPVPGEGFDEHIMSLEFERRDLALQYQSEALVLHVDTKTLKEAQAGIQRCGETACGLMMSSQATDYVRSYFTRLVTKRKRAFWKQPRVVWFAPGLISVLSSGLVWIADRGPPRWLPARVCYVPLALAFWQGVHARMPSYRALQSALADHVSVE